MKWNSDEGQKILAVAYALQSNYSNAASTPKTLIKRLVQGWVYGRYSYKKGGWEYSLQPFEEREQERPSEARRIVSKGRTPISEEKIAEIKRMRLEGRSIRSIADSVGVGRGTVEKYIKG